MSKIISTKALVTDFRGGRAIDEPWGTVTIDGVVGDVIPASLLEGDLTLRAVAPEHWPEGATVIFVINWHDKKQGDPGGDEFYVTVQPDRKLVVVLDKNYLNSLRDRQVRIYYRYQSPETVEYSDVSFFECAVDLYSVRVLEGTGSFRRTISPAHAAEGVTAWIRLSEHRKAGDVISLYIGGVGGSSFDIAHIQITDEHLQSGIVLPIAAKYLAPRSGSVVGLGYTLNALGIERSGPFGWFNVAQAAPKPFIEFERSIGTYDTFYFRGDLDATLQPYTSMEAGQEIIYIVAAVGYHYPITINWFHIKHRVEPGEVGQPLTLHVWESSVPLVRNLNAVLVFIRQTASGSVLGCGEFRTHYLSGSR